VRVQAKEVERTEMFGREIAIFKQAFKNFPQKKAIKLRKDSGVFVAPRESLEVTVAALESGSMLLSNVWASLGVSPWFKVFTIGS